MTVLLRNIRRSAMGGARTQIVLVVLGVTLALAAIGALVVPSSGPPAIAHSSSTEVRSRVRAESPTLGQGLATETAIFGVLTRVFSNTRIDSDADVANVRLALDRVLGSSDLFGLRVTRGSELAPDAVRLDDYEAGVTSGRIDGVECVIVSFVRRERGPGAYVLLQSCDSPVLVGVEAEGARPNTTGDVHRVECNTTGSKRDLVWLEFFDFVRRYRL